MCVMGQAGSGVKTAAVGSAHGRHAWVARHIGLSKTGWVRYQAGVGDVIGAHGITGLAICLMAMAGTVGGFVRVAAAACAGCSQLLLLQGSGSGLITLPPQQLDVADIAEDWADEG
jgi:hypothetical protein